VHECTSNYTVKFKVRNRVGDNSYVNVYCCETIFVCVSASRPTMRRDVSWSKCGNMLTTDLRMTSYMLWDKLLVTYKQVLSQLIMYNGTSLCHCI
jgi:hypothetical protein